MGIPVYPSSGHLNREDGDRWIWDIHHCQTSLICFVFGISCPILSRWVESCEVTAYDFPSGRFARQAGVELVLVGDSCGTQLQPDLKSSGQLFLFPLFFFSFFRAWNFCSQSHKNPLFLISLNILNSWRIPCLSIKAFSNLVDHQRKANDRQLGVPEVLAIVGVALDWKHEQNLGDSYPFIWSGKIRGGVAPGFTTKKVIPHFFSTPVVWSQVCGFIPCKATVSVGYLISREVI